jgi:hypothetical protein
MTQDALAFGAELPHRSIPTSVAESGARLQPVRPKHVKCEVEHEFGCLGEESRAPEF